MDRSRRASLHLSRRQLIAASASAATLTILTPYGRLTPKQAHARGVSLTVLTPEEADALGAFGEVILPGAIEDGLIEYLDSQLAQDDGGLLLIRYLDYPPPFVDFYRAVAAALDGLGNAQANARFAELGSDEQRDLVGQIMTDQAEPWSGPPASLAYFVVRSDAVDVVYGTVDGFAKLDIPYMPHITPTERW